MAGMDPIRFLQEGNPFMRSLMLAVAAEARRQSEIRDQNLAVRIADQVGRLFK